MEFNGIDLSLFAPDSGEKVGGDTVPVVVRRWCDGGGNRRFGDEPSVDGTWGGEETVLLPVVADRGWGP